MNNDEIKQYIKDNLTFEINLTCRYQNSIEINLIVNLEGEEIANITSSDSLNR